jgi:UTP--glucose-1-phosphate uridylyltransferase
MAVFSFYRTPQTIFTWVATMKGLILAAGYGTPFLPISKAVPKEMLPLVDRPLIDIIVQEFLDSGISEILMITSRRKKTMEDYFDRELEMEWEFEKEGAAQKLKTLMRVSELADIHFLRQKELLGSGHAIYLARRFLGHDPFVVAYPGDIFLSNTPATKQLLEIFDLTGKHVLGATPIIDPESIQRFGCLDLEVVDGINYVINIAEKPMPGTFKGQFISVGRYIFKPDIIPIFRRLLQRPRPGDVIFQTDAIKVLHKGEVVAKIIEGERLDVSTPMEYIKSFTKYALSRDEFKHEYAAYLKILIQLAREGKLTSLN